MFLQDWCEVKPVHIPLVLVGLLLIRLLLILLLRRLLLIVLILLLILWLLWRTVDRDIPCGCMWHASVLVVVTCFCRK